MDIGDTIAAVSTPRGKGGVALLRVSGGDAAAIADRIFKPAGGRRFSSLPPRTAVYGDIYSREPDGSCRKIDDGIAVFYKAPSSFTGEDTAEICCHGGTLITQTVLEALLCAGARAAEAGEFTRRAFINGRLGLSEAEALASLLEAKTHNQLILSRAGLDGALAGAAREIYAELRRLVSDIYARVDFPDEDLAGLTRAELEAGVLAVGGRLRSLAATYRTGRAVAEGVACVICGRTNSGKSSLYNAIVGSDDAIVTDVEGTTRDLLESTVSFGGVTLRLCDTAGLRRSEDRVECIGIERARRRIDEAELILALFDGSRPADDEDRALLGLISSRAAPAVAVITKSDLPRVLELPLGALPSVCISTLTGEGMETLAAVIAKMFIDGNIDLSADPVAVTARQYASLTRAADSAENSLGALRSGLPEDICCSDLELAMSALADIDGREVSADIVSEIFSRFCVGK